MAQVYIGIDVLDIFGLLALSLGLFICVPIIIYYLYKIRQIEDSPILKHRQITSIYTLNVLTLSTIICLELFIFIFCVWNNDDKFIELEWMIHVLNAIFTLPIFIVFALKTYLLYFEQQYQMAIMNITWLKHINSFVTDWYIAKRHTFGNFNYLLFISFGPYVLMIICYFIVQIFSGKTFIFHILTMLFTFIPLSIASILFYSVKGFHDLFGICNEIKYQMILICVMFILYLSLFLICECLSMTNTLKRIQWITYIVFINILFFSLSVLSTSYPVYLNLYGIKDPNDPTGNRRLILNKSSLRTIYHRGHTKQIPKQKMATNIKHLLQCISNQKHLNQFMQHLVHEFSSENMLFLVELIQVKYSFQELNNGVIKVPKSIYHIHETSRSMRSSGSFKLGLNIGNYSFSQQSSPQHITQISPSNNNKDVNQTSICSLSDEDMNLGSLKIDANLIKDVSIENGLYQVIDFNAEQTHHHHSSSSFLGNWSPSASYSSLMMMDSYPETDTKARTISNHKQEARTESKTQHDLTPTLKVPKTRSRSSSNLKKMTSFSYLFSNDGKLLHRIRLPQGLPPSKILMNDDNLRDRMIALYNKYIGYGSIHQLNLCFSLKNRMDIIFKSQIIYKSRHESMYNILDEVAVSVLHLMKDSFNRFKYIPKNNKKQQISLDIAVKKPVLRNASSFSDVINTYSNGKDIKISI